MSICVEPSQTYWAILECPAQMLIAMKQLYRSMWQFVIWTQSGPLKSSCDCTIKALVFHKIRL